MRGMRAVDGKLLSNLYNYSGLMYINFRSQNFYTFLVIWAHVLLLQCNARGYFCCLLINNIVDINNFFGGPTCNKYLSSCNILVWQCYGFGNTALQQG